MRTPFSIPASDTMKFSVSQFRDQAMLCRGRNGSGLGERRSELGQEMPSRVASLQCSLLPIDGDPQVA